jgi:predicted DNA-binding transcriptional regulator YafY
MRVFSVDRIESPVVLETVTFDPPEEVVRAELDTSYGIFTGEANQMAVLKFNEMSARWVAQERWHDAAEVQAHEDGSVILRIPYNRNTELIMEILRYGPDCEVIEPASLREAVVERLNAALSGYR